VTSATKIFRACSNSLIYIVVTLLVLAAVSLSLVRVLLPSIVDYKSDIEIWVSELIGQQIEIATLDAAWYGLEPQLVLKGVQLLSEDRMQTHGYFQQARLGIDLISSAMEGRVRPGAFTLEGARFVLIRHEDGNITLEGFGDPNSTTSDAEKNRLLEEWFFQQRLLDVKGSEIVWQDLTKSKKQWVFSGVNLRFRNDGQRHWIDGSVELPHTLGNRLEIAIDARGSLFSANAWAGNAYLEGERLNLAELSRNFSLENLNITEGEMNLRLWTQWRNAKLRSVHGTAKVNKVQLAAQNAPKIRVINSISTNFVAHKNATDWESTFDKVLIASGRSQWPQSRVDIKYNPVSKSLLSEITYLDLGEVLPVAAFFMHKNKEVSETISRLKAKGVVSNLKISVNDVDGENQFLTRGVFSNFSNRAWKEYPGISQLDGQFDVSNHAIKVTLPKQSFSLDYRQNFSHKHDVENFKSLLFATFNEEGLQFAAKETALKFKKVNVAGSFSFKNLANENPHLDLAYYFKGGLVSDVKYYIPSKLMPDPTVEWLEESLRSGNVNHGGLSYFGDVSKFPFWNAEGVFNVNLDIKNGNLRFSENWPRITSINGVFDLQANSLSFFGLSGKTKNSVLENVEVKLPDYRATDNVLTIVGKAFGATSDKLSYLLSSPMGEDFAKQVEPLTLEGDSDLDLDLSIPLNHPENVKVFGELSLKENHLLANEWKLDISQVAANLRFNNDGIWSDDLKGKIKQTELAGRIETVRDDNGVRLLIHSSSLVSQEEISELLAYFIDKGYWANYFEGEAEVDTNLIVPLSGVDKKLQFTLRSSLEGMQVNLPYPLRKEEEDSKNLLLFTELTGKKRLLKIEYGSTQSLFEIVATKADQQIRRGAIGFQQVVELPAEIGYRFSGKLKEFNWKEWEPLLVPNQDQKALVEGDGSFGSIYFDVAVDEFSLFGSKFGPTTIQASQTSQLWSMHLAGNELEGQIFIPVVLSSAPLVMDMRRLHISPGKSLAGETAVSPKIMPEIKLDVDDFRYENIQFGKLKVVAEKIPTGLRLAEFSMVTSNTSITALGDWVTEDEKQKSNFNIKINSENMGKAIKNWGYAGAIGGGSGEVNLEVNWPGKPTDFSFKTASGNVDLSIKDASMLDFELGATKMFGLLLPRRLILDFRDVFKRGMHFDEIKGKYKIQAGDSFTSGLFLNGPVADIHMAGRIGLNKRDYDQVVTVNRRILGDSMPVLAALTANPLIAAQVFIFKKMFEKQIDDILSIQYTIVGSWEDPVITPVIKNPATGEDLTEDILGE